jgi:hypothetical protein
MSNNIIDLNQSKKTKRDKKGWSIEEIKQKAKDEAAEFSKNMTPEPKDLVSGDMDKIIKGQDDE